MQSLFATNQIQFYMVKILIGRQLRKQSGCDWIAKEARLKVNKVHLN